MSSGPRKKILIVDDDAAFRIGTRALLEDHGYRVTLAANGGEAKKIVTDQGFDLILSDVLMPGMTGIELLKYIRTHLPGVPVIMITGFASINAAVEAMRLGAHDYIAKPSDNDELLIRISRTLTEQDKDRELRRLREEVHGLYAFGSIVGQNHKMKEVYTLVKQVADPDVTALILGETGTGKELVAKAIHYNSSRRDKPFVVVNCSALPATLMESELFGHEKGSFTGAHRQHTGKFEDAEGGTVFLDEVGELPVQIQTRLLRVLQEKTIQRVGGNAEIKVNVRVVAATNRDLAPMVAQGGFREDLYYRLNVFPIHLPPLRERLDDLPLLVDFLIRKHSTLSNYRVKNISPSLLPAMMNYEWKGNIRELENLIKRAIIKTQGETIQSIDVPFGTSNLESTLPASHAGGEDIPYKEYLKRSTQHAEALYLKKMLEKHHGNIKAIALAMDLDRKTIYRIVEEAGIDLSEYRRPNSPAGDEDTHPE